MTIQFNPNGKAHNALKIAGMVGFVIAAVFLRGNGIGLTILYLFFFGILSWRLYRRTENSFGDKRSAFTALAGVLVFISIGFALPLVSYVADKAVKDGWPLVEIANNGFWPQMIISILLVAIGSVIRKGIIWIPILVAIVATWIIGWGVVTLLMAFTAAIATMIYYVLLCKAYYQLGTRA